MQSDHMQGVTSANLSARTWKTPQSGQKAGRAGLRRDQLCSGCVGDRATGFQRTAALTLTAQNSPTWRTVLLSPFGRSARTLRCIANCDREGYIPTIPSRAKVHSECLSGYEVGQGKEWHIPFSVPFSCTWLAVYSRQMRKS